MALHFFGYFIAAGHTRQRREPAGGGGMHPGREDARHAPKSSYISISVGTPRFQSIFLTDAAMGPGPHM